MFRNVCWLQNHPTFLGPSAFTRLKKLKKYQAFKSRMSWSSWFMIFVTFLRIKFLAPKFSPPKTHHHLFALKKMVIAAAPHRISGLFKRLRDPSQVLGLVGCIIPFAASSKVETFSEFNPKVAFKIWKFDGISAGPFWTFWSSNSPFRILFLAHCLMLAVPPKLGR